MEDRSRRYNIRPRQTYSIGRIYRFCISRDFLKSRPLAATIYATFLVCSAPVPRAAADRLRSPPNDTVLNGMSDLGTSGLHATKRSEACSGCSVTPASIRSSAANSTGSLVWNAAAAPAKVATFRVVGSEMSSERPRGLGHEPPGVDPRGAHGRIEGWISRS